VGLADCLVLHAGRALELPIREDSHLVPQTTYQQVSGLTGRYELHRLKLASQIVVVAVLLAALGVTISLAALICLFLND
jgi:hypothetical protein